LPVAPVSDAFGPLPTGRFRHEMRALVGKLQPLVAQRKSVLLLIAASNPGEGTSTVASGIAFQAAADGYRALLCSSLDPAGLGIVPQTVPESVTAHPPSLILQPTQLRNLAWGGIRKLTVEDGSVSAYSYLGQQLDRTREHFDFSVVDCPPTRGQPVWSPMLAFADGVILVVEAEKTRSMVLKNTVRTIEDSSGHLLGVVFNKRRTYVPGFLYRFL
jgi:Mrp family chromosome partitioning ATPase